MRIGWAALATALVNVFLSGSCGDDGAGGGECTFSTPADDVPDPQIHTPRWAFEPWISKDISDGADTAAFVGGFRDRDIPVGVLVLDSPWETQYNTFVPNEERYPDFADMVAGLRADGVRTVLWVTQMVNSGSFDLERGGDDYDGPSPNFQEAYDCDFFVNRGETFAWWKGFGAGLDFFNPEAVAWWRRQQDPLLDAGIAGWKLDFGDQYLPDELETAAGTVDRQDYSEAYYHDFYAYGASRLGTDEFVTMVRPYDESYQFDGRFFARPEDAPVAWVGDNRRDWVGLKDALDEIFRSARAGYVVIGSDIGGYLDVDDANQTIKIPYSTETFSRWVAVGALSPLMELHGRANLAPWTVPDDADRFTALYRYWAWLHSDLVPFFYSLAEEAYAGGEPIIRPQGDESEWPDDYRYMLGDAFLVAPILADGGVRDVELPAGTWYDWWDSSADPVIAGAGGTTLSDVSYPDWERIPLYVRGGAIVPMQIRNDATGIGSDAWADDLTVLVYPGSGDSSFVLHETDGDVTTISVTGGGAQISLSRATRATVVRAWTSTAPSDVAVDGTSVAASASRSEFDQATEATWWSDDAARFTYVLVPAGTSTRTVTLTP